MVRSSRYADGNADPHYQLSLRRKNASLHPVFRGKDAVDLGVRCYQAGLAHQRRHAIAAFPVGLLLAGEWRGAAVRPGERLGAVVGRVDDDSIVGVPSIDV